MLFIDVGPLLENKFTGIPQLTWHVVRYWLEQADHDVRFFVGNLELNRAAVEAIARQRTGRYHQACNPGGGSAGRPISTADAKRAIAFYPHTRPIKDKVFRRETRVIHDLSTLLTPELHPPELGPREAYDFAREIELLDHVICVSNATRDDLIRYCGLDGAKASVAYPGVEWFESHVKIYDSPHMTGFEKYVLVLGTFEPRKNVQFVFEYIKKNRSILGEYMVCFCGSAGWGKVYEQCMADPEIGELLRSGRVRVLPFVEERVKYALMKEASFLIYPSLYEGFGSPVAEALSLGVPAVVSFGGSLPEVAGEAGYYFDPYSLGSLEQAVERVLFDLAHRNAETRMAAYRQGARFTWPAFNRKIHDIVERLQ
jgi:glycosyltransferase involved in cell wall biosynthesis